MAAGKTVDSYLAGLEGWQADVGKAVRDLIREAAPEAKESIKWSHPVYEVSGPVCYFTAHSGHVNFGFWRGAELDDPQGLLQGTGEKMRHVKITRPDDLKPDALKALVCLAVSKNLERGDPAKRP